MSIGGSDETKMRGKLLGKSRRCFELINACRDIKLKVNSREKRKFYVIFVRILFLFGI
jgi:hypothetical protein